MTDQRKLERLFNRHYRQMYRLANTLLHDDAESKDVVHDIFARLLDDHRDLQEETAESYLLACVRNRCLNVIRNRQIHERVEHLYLLDLDAPASPAEGGRLEEELKALDKGLDQLDPPVCRDIILQHFRDGVTFREIACRLGVSQTTVYKHLRRALSQLRTHLKNTKFAAMLVGILMLSGLVYAAIYLVRHVGGEQQSSTKVTRIGNSLQRAAVTDTIVPTLPKRYDNVPLGEMFEELSAYYHVKVVYRNEAARKIRLFYQWKPDYPMERVVEMLNNFEWLQLELAKDTLFVSSTVEPQP